MCSVRYEIEEGGPIVFLVDVEGLGAVKVTSGRKGIFSCRVTDRNVLALALRAAEDFADAHESELQPHYDNIAKEWSTRDVVAIESAADNSLP